MLDTENAVRSVLSRIAEWNSPGSKIDECNIVQVRKHLGKRMAFVALTVSDHDGSERRSDVVLKHDGRRRAKAVAQALRQLREAGLRPPAHFRVPEPLGASGDGLVLAQEWVAGRPWADTLGNDDASRASARAAEWLLALQSLDVAAVASEAPLIGPSDLHPDLPASSGPSAPRAVLSRSSRHRDRSELRDGSVTVANEREPLLQSPVQTTTPAAISYLTSVDRYAREVAAAHPHEAPAIRRLASRLLDGLASSPEPPLPSHGDLHPKNLLLDGEVVTAVDLDTFGLREAAFDVGYAIGELLIMSHLRLGEAAAGLVAARAFWLRYLERGGTAGPQRVSLHVARTFLQSLHYELCVLRNSRNELLGRWPELAREWMERDGLASLEGALRHR